MDIDLLLSNDGECGLIAGENLVKKAIGVLLDTQTGILTLEYADSDYTELNIPVEGEFFALMDACARIHVGAVKNGNIAQAYQVPLMFLDDPYRGEALRNVREASNPLQAFNYFVTRCTAGQPVHRDDLGDEGKMGCILGDASPTALKFAPHLARRHALENVHKIGTPTHAPRMGGPGLGGSSGGGTYSRPINNKDTDKE
ncbi:MAG: hypothetical protein WBK77_00075 [Alphaproteobacteria bacterium]